MLHGNMRAMDRLKSLEIFRAVAERRSFTQAATALGLSAAVVTRAVQDLEQLLGARLLHRSTRSVVPTREGASVLARAAGVLDAFEALAVAGCGQAGELSGDIRFTAPASFGAARLTPLLTDFMARHPQVRIELVLTDTPLSIEAEGVDLALRIAHALPEHLVARRVGEVAVGVYGAPAYLARRGMPRDPAELAAHDCVVHSSAGRVVPWQLCHPVTGERSMPTARRLFSANHVEAVLVAAALGTGLAMLPRVLADPLVARGELRPVLASWSCPSPGIHLVYRERRLQPSRVRGLIDHLVQAFESGRIDLPRPARSAARQAPALRLQ